MEVSAGAPAPGRIGHPNLRGSFLAFVIVGGGVLIAVGKRPCNGFANAGTAAGDAFASAGALAIWAAIVASVVVLTRRRRKGDGSFRSALISGPPIAITCILAFGGIVGGATDRTNKCRTSASRPTTNPVLKAEQDQFIAWITAWFACLTPNGTTLTHEHNQLEAALKSTSAKAAQVASASALRAFSDSASCITRLPAGNADIAKLDQQVVAGSGLQVHAYQLYRRGVDELIAGKGSATLTLGDTYIAKADRILGTMRSEGEALYLRLGGQAALGSRLPLQAFQNAKAKQ
jgi:hypothetical protein